MWIAVARAHLEQMKDKNWNQSICLFDSTWQMKIITVAWKWNCSCKNINCNLFFDGFSFFDFVDCIREESVFCFGARVIEINEENYTVLVMRKRRRFLFTNFLKRLLTVCVFLISHVKCIVVDLQWMIGRMRTRFANFIITIIKIKQKRKDSNQRRSNCKMEGFFRVFFLIRHHKSSTRT